MDLLTEPLVWLDLETGGTDERVHQITQIAAQATEGPGMVPVGEPFERKCLLVDGHYTTEALEVQGHTEERWADAIPVQQAVDEFGSWLRSHCHKATSKKGSTYPVAHAAGHNLAFDVRFLDATCKRMKQGSSRGYWLPLTKWTGGYLCTMQLATWVRALYGHQYKSLQLGDLCDYYDLAHPDDHDAMGDVLATIELGRALANQLRYDWGADA